MVALSGYNSSDGALAALANTCRASAAAARGCARITSESPFPCMYTSEQCATAVRTRLLSLRRNLHRHSRATLQITRRRCDLAHNIRCKMLSSTPRSSRMIAAVAASAAYCATVIVTAQSHHMLRLQLSPASAQCRTGAYLFHSRPAAFSVTGISFNPLPPAELKVIQWQKKEQIAARRREVHALAAKIWASHPNEPWHKLTMDKSSQLLQQLLNAQPTEFETREFYLHTLQQKCKWRYDEVLSERKSFFETCWAAVQVDIRAEAKSYAYGTLSLTKNDLTNKLTHKMKTMPTSEEVEAAWADRYNLPTIEWKEDAI